MFERLKAIFFSREEAEEEEVSREGLLQWIEAKEKINYRDAFKRIEQKKLAILEQIKKSEDDIELLKRAELKNKNIPKRALQLMQGNRESYVKKTRDFLRCMDTDFDDLEAAQDFLKRFEEQLELLNKSNNKSYYVLQEFFANETSKIAQGIKALEKTAAELRQILTDSGLDSISELREIIIQMYNRISHKKELGIELEIQKKELANELSQKKSLIAQLEQLKKSREFMDFENLKKERDDTVSRIKKQEDLLFHMFSVLETGLKKYARMSLDENIVKSYIKNPARALVNDKELVILKILDNMKKNITENKIEMKDKKKEKILVMVDKLAGDHIKDFRFEFDELKRTKRIKDEKITKNTIMQDYNEFDYKLSHLKQKIEVAERNLNSTEKAYEKIELCSLESQLKQKAEKAFGIRLILS